MKMSRKSLSTALQSLFSLGVGAPLPTILPSGLLINGGVADPTSQIAFLNQVIANLIAAQGYPFTTSASASATVTPAPNGVYRYTNGGAVTITLDYAYNIVAALANPFVGQTYSFAMAATGATTIATPTLSDTAVTLSGTTSVVAAAAREYQVKVTQVVTTAGSALTAGSTFTSLTQVGSTNAFTVALGTNAISPTVGNGFYIGTTTGTLPAGWYPVVSVSSATSFVIATPPGTVWTATAATLNGATTIPSSGYTPGLAGLFSPLITITGAYAYATGTVVV